MKVTANFFFQLFCYESVEFYPKRTGIFYIYNTIPRPALPWFLIRRDEKQNFHITRIKKKRWERKFWNSMTQASSAYRASFPHTTRLLLQKYLEESFVSLSVSFCLSVSLCLSLIFLSNLFLSLSLFLSFSVLVSLYYNALRVVVGGCGWLWLVVAGCG